MDDRLVGRAGFLGLLGAGVAGLFFARDFTSGIGRLLPRQVGDVVPGSGWRIYTIGDRMPSLDPAAFSLRVEGLGRPSVISLADVKAMPRTDIVRDFHCVTGWSVGDVRWSGVRVRDLLERLGPGKPVASLRFVSAEVPYEDSLTLAQATLDDVLLAYEMDGAPLSRPHGAPLRLVMPRMYGYKSVKWVRSLELRPDVAPGFWEQHGYDADAWLGRSNGYGS